MRTPSALIIALVLALSCRAYASESARGIDDQAPRGAYDVSKPIPNQEHWPAGLAELLSSHASVSAFYGGHVHHFYYEGKTEAFNAFLEKYAKSQGGPLTLVIHIGPGKAPIYSPGAPSNPVPMDWHVFVRPPMIPDGGIVKGQEDQRIVTVELWLGGQVDLRAIKVPDNVKVVDGGDITRFISDLEKQRNLNSQ